MWTHPLPWIDTEEEIDMTNKRIRKKKLKKLIREESPQTVKDALAGYVDRETFDSKTDFLTYLNSLVTESR